MGPMTGRGGGYCGGYEVPGYANPVPGRGYGMGWGAGPGRGRGMGWGRGGGRGWGLRNRYYATGVPGWARAGYGPVSGPPPPAGYGPVPGPPAPAAYGPYAGPTREQEAEGLRAQAEWLKGELDAISERISALEQEE